MELAQEPLPWSQAVNSSLGPSRAFYFRVNGLPVYAKGANNIPSDQFESRVTPELLWDYLSSAKDAHFNMLRVWGGGLCERDEFFEYCDQLGIMIYRASHTACHRVSSTRLCVCPSIYTCALPLWHRRHDVQRPNLPVASGVLSVCRCGNDIPSAPAVIPPKPGALVRNE